MPKILHIAPDEKFIDSVNYQFEKIYKEQNHFIILVQKENHKLKYIKTIKSIELLILTQKTLKKLLATFDKYDIIVLHGMSFSNSRIVLKYKQKEKFIYIFWGGEIYNNPYGLGKTSIGQKTRNHFPVNKNIKGKIRQFVQHFVHPIKYGTPPIKKSIIKAIKQVFYIGILHKEDFNMLKNNNFISSKTAYFKYSYYPLEFIFKGIKDVRVTDNNILLGNSASASNNHLEAFSILKRLNLNTVKVITPLSYGSKEYANEIIKIGKQELGDNFQPITKFIPLEEYNQYLKQCGIVIMNHYRQQAVGNILAMIWMGAKVYLDKRNTVYHYLKRIGIIVFSISDDLVPENINALTLLSEKEIRNNKSILINEIGEEQLLNSIRMQIESSK